MAWLNANNMIYTEFHFQNKMFHYYPGKNVITFSNGVHFIDGDETSFQRFVNNTQLITFILNGQEYNLFINFETRKGNAYGVDNEWISTVFDEDSFIAYMME